ncbi:hypothetical protein ACFO3O_12885 [Dokdonia ponticola]|uniref:Bacteriocin n=1 Tax=Dokdonia ponticola TaxID=2041041 RepID=A0ABV9HZ99_9FLAO
MLKNLSKIKEVRILGSKDQQVITGGNACIACYDHCMLVSRDRIELGDCFDNCQQTAC